MSKSFWPIIETLTDTLTLDQSGPGSNGNGAVLSILQWPRKETSLSNAV